MRYIREAYFYHFAEALQVKVELEETRRCGASEGKFRWHHFRFCSMI